MHSFIFTGAYRRTVIHKDPVERYFKFRRQLIYRKIYLWVAEVVLYCTNYTKYRISESNTKCGMLSMDPMYPLVLYFTIMKSL